MNILYIIWGITLGMFFKSSNKNHKKTKKRYYFDKKYNNVFLIFFIGIFFVFFIYRFIFGDFNTIKNAILDEGNIKIYIMFLKAALLVIIIFFFLIIYNIFFKNIYSENKSYKRITRRK